MATRSRARTYAAPVEFAVLGPIEVHDGDATVDIRPGLPRVLLLVLLSQPGRMVASDTLIEILWGDDLPVDPANALQGQISYLRKRLRDGEEPLIATRPGGYQLNVRLEQIDAWRFERLVRRAERLAASGTASGLRDALDDLDVAFRLWRGSPFADAGDRPFALVEARRLEEVSVAAAEARVECLLSLGRHRDAISAVTQLIGTHPFRERFHEQHMLALYRAGRQAEALRAYEAARTTLVEELGLDPGHDMQRLHRMILDHAPELGWSAPPGLEISTSDASANGRARRPVQPPIPLTSLIGRGTALARVRQCLETGRLVTLTGPGGAGKSRLALEVARLGPAERDVCFVDLAGVERDDLVAATVAAALGVTVQPREEPVDSIVAAIAGSELLILLDTCEHVSAGAARLARVLLETGPGIRVLATSRRPLGIRGELAWPVPPLALPGPGAPVDEVHRSPAVALFAERAAAVDPTFELDADNAADVAAVCAAVDGLPLAIELAAAHCDVLSPAAIHRRLVGQIDLLPTAVADVAARQRTLRSTVEWSFRLLEPDEQRQFCQLSVFRGSFTLDAAGAVTGLGADAVLDPIASLVRQSLVTAVGGDRYRLLDPIRHYAAEQLATTDGAAGARSRHADYYATLAEAADGGIRTSEQNRWLTALRVELPNLRAAIEWGFDGGDPVVAARTTAALAWFWTIDGMLAEALRHLDAANAVQRLPPQTAASVQFGIALVCAPLGQLQRSLDAARAAADLARRAGCRGLLGLILNTMAVPLWAFDDHTAAAAAQDEAIELLAEAGDRWGHAIALALRTRTAVDAGDPQAPQLASQALAAARGVDEGHLLGLVHEQLTRLALRAGDLDSAADLAMLCLAAHEQISHPEGTVAALHLLGKVRLAQDERTSAKHLHVRALDLALRIGHAGGICEALEDLAAVAAADADRAGALELLAVAEQERHRLGVPRRSVDREAIAALQDELAEPATDTVVLARAKNAREILAELT